MTIATPLLQVHARDFADLRPGDRDRLTLAGRHRLSGLEVRLQREVVFPQYRHPAGQLEVLVREDVAADERRDHDHRDHRDERRAVAPDLVADTQPALMGLGDSGLIRRSRLLDPDESGPLKFGTAWV